MKLHEITWSLDEVEWSKMKLDEVEMKWNDDKDENWVKSNERCKKYDKLSKI